MSTRTSLFGSFAEDYDRFRPGYPDAVWDLLALAEGERVADIGAGTGRASAALAARGLRVTAVEPDPAMAAIARAQATRAGGAFAVVEATAERTRLGPESQAAVIAAQAYHWFEVPAANLEAARILRPGGLFVALWNDRVVDGVGWMEEFETLIQRFNPAHKRDYRDFDVAARMGQGGVFSEFLSAELPNEWEVDTQQFVGFARTLSYVRDVVTPADLTRYEAEVRRLILVAHGKGSFVVPMKTRITIGRKAAST